MISHLPTGTQVISHFGKLGTGSDLTPALPDENRDRLPKERVLLQKY